MSNTNAEVDLLRIYMTDESRGHACFKCGHEGDSFQVCMLYESRLPSFPADIHVITYPPFSYEDSEGNRQPLFICDKCATGFEEFIKGCFEEYIK